MVEYIEYKGEQLPVKVGYYALKHFQKKTKGKGMIALQEDFSLYEDLLFYALKKGAMEEQIPFQWKITDMENILEDTLFTQFLGIVEDALDVPEDTKKKKAVGTGNKLKK